MLPCPNLPQQSKKVHTLPVSSALTFLVNSKEMRRGMFAKNQPEIQSVSGIRNKAMLIY